MQKDRLKIIINIVISILLIALLNFSYHQLAIYRVDTEIKNKNSNYTKNILEKTCAKTDIKELKKCQKEINLSKISNYISNTEGFIFLSIKNLIIISIIILNANYIRKQKNRIATK